MLGPGICQLYNHPRNGIPDTGRHRSPRSRERRSQPRLRRRLRPYRRRLLTTPSIAALWKGQTGKSGSTDSRPNTRRARPSGRPSEVSRVQSHARRSAVRRRMVAPPPELGWPSQTTYASLTPNIGGAGTVTKRQYQPRTQPPDLFTLRRRVGSQGDVRGVLLRVGAGGLVPGATWRACNNRASQR